MGLIKCVPIFVVAGVVAGVMACAGRAQGAGVATAMRAEAMSVGEAAMGTCEEARATPSIGVIPDPSIGARGPAAERAAEVIATISAQAAKASLKIVVAAPSGTEKAAPKSEKPAGEPEKPALKPAKPPLNGDAAPTAKDVGDSVAVAAAKARHEEHVAYQRAALAEVLAKKVNVIVLMPLANVEYGEMLREARDAGVHVVCLNPPASLSDPAWCDVMVRENYVEQGMLASEALIKACGKVPGVMELRGEELATATVERSQGVMEVLAKQRQVHLMGSVVAEPAKRAAVKVVTKALSDKGERLNGFVAHDPQIALEALAAAEQAGRHPGKDVFVVSIGTNAAARAKLSDGSLACIVDGEAEFAKAVCDAATALAEGKPVARNIETHSTVQKK